MAKGAANEKQLGGLHSLLATVFEKTLQKYMKDLEAMDAIDIVSSEEQVEQLEENFLHAVLEIKEPNPAMLSAISKFLKDNDIGMDSEEIDKLSGTERRLQDKRKLRAERGLNVVDIGYAEHGS